jgi:hypothetical protein
MSFAAAIPARRGRPLLRLVNIVVALAAALRIASCGMPGTTPGTAAPGAPDSGDGEPQGGVPPSVPEDGGQVAGPDAGTADGGGAESGALVCPAPGSFNVQNSSGHCDGQPRWSVMTGADADAALVNLMPVETSVAALISLARPATLPVGHRVEPVETTTYLLRNVQLNFVALQFDSDYHVAVTDGMNTMRVEVPFPPCVSATSQFGCFLSRVRGTVDRVLVPGMGPLRVNVTVTVAGVGFWDEHTNEDGAAPNGIELHPVLAICFGRDCTFG